MPSTPRPKIYEAVREFSCAGSRFKPGEVVPKSAALAAALRHGDKFVRAQKSESSKKSDAPVPEPSISEKE